MEWPTILVVSVFVLAGGLAAVLARRLLGRLRRGARVRAGPCELLLAAAWGATGAGWMAGWLPVRTLPLLLGLGWLGVTAGAVDVRHRRLPDALTGPAVPGGLVLLAPLGVAAVARGLAGAVLALVVYGLVHRFAPAALGAGDVKLAVSLGAALGGLGWAAPVLAAGLAGALTVTLALLSRQRVVPHGPGMLAGAWTVAWLSVAGATDAAAGGG